MTGTIRRPARRRTRPPRRVVPVRQPVSSARIVMISGLMLAVAAALVGRLIDLQLTPDPRIVNEVTIPRGEIAVPAPRGPPVSVGAQAASKQASAMVVDGARRIPILRS